MKTILSLALIFISTFAFSQIPEPLKDTYVNDFAHVLSPAQVSSLNQSIAGIEKASGVQFAIILINNLPKDNTIEDYTLLISRKWHVGNNKNGLVYVAAIQQHKQRLEKASGLDTIFTSQKSDEILSAIKPSFKSKDYYGGLQVLIGQVGTTLSGVSTQPEQQTQAVQTQQQQPEQAGQPNDSSDAITIFGFIAASVLILIIWVAIRSSIRRNRRNNYNNSQGPNNIHIHQNHSSSDGFVNGALLGAMGALVVNEILDDSSGQQVYDDDNDDVDPHTINTNDNDSGGSWGDWGSGGDSSSDSGFSSDDSSSGSSSDW
ncbi:MAG: TPM domain-containing protein [Mucilaginibacter sp.]|uniref:TPM domain-containing protein n=1 Tax=Mucilaginibacter sp. TaxID=1882438 RepID=UPI0032679639